MEFQLGFFNGSSSSQDWSLFLDQTSIATFTLAAGRGTPRYIKVQLDDGDKVEMTVDTEDGNTAAVLTRVSNKLVLTSNTPNEWQLDQETGTQYLVTCKLS